MKMLPDVQARNGYTEPGSQPMTMKLPIPSSKGKSTTRLMTFQSSLNRWKSSFRSKNVDFILLLSEMVTIPSMVSTKGFTLARSGGISIQSSARLIFPSYTHTSGNNPTHLLSKKSLPSIKSFPWQHLLSTPLTLDWLTSVPQRCRTFSQSLHTSFKITLLYLCQAAVVGRVGYGREPLRETVGMSGKRRVGASHGEMWNSLIYITHTHTHTVVCNGIECSGHGTCYETSSTHEHVCICDADHWGMWCEFDGPDLCNHPTVNQCWGHGTCVYTNSTSNGYTCLCSHKGKG